MENRVRIFLPKKFSDLLETLPEQGMGYQIVDIFFKNGSSLSKRIVFNSSILELEKGEEINVRDIDTIKLHAK